MNRIRIQIIVLVLAILGTGAAGALLFGFQVPAGASSAYAAAADPHSPSAPLLTDTPMPTPTCALLKGYRVVGCNFSGSNAFFVRADLCADHFVAPATAEEHYEPPRHFFSFLLAGPQSSARRSWRRPSAPI